MACSCAVAVSLWIATVAVDAQPPVGKPKDAPSTPPPADDGQAKPEPAADAKAEPEPKPAPPPEKKFFEQEAFDVITLDKANNNAKLKVMPLQFPGGRKMPDPKPAGKLTCRLFDNRTEEAEIFWRNIEDITFFEELVLNETEKIVANARDATRAGNHREAQNLFDEAFEYFRFLLRYYPNTTNLKSSLQVYLYNNAFSLVTANRIAEATAIFEELYRQNPSFQHEGYSIQVLLESVLGRLIKQYVDDKDYVSTRVLLERLEADYGNRLKVIDQWRSHLVGIAAGLRDQAQAHLDAERFRAAHDSSRDMLKVWPRVEGGRELILEIARQYPLVVVGVTQTALQFDPSSYDNNASRRVGYLMHQSLVEFVDRGPEGGQYACPYGAVVQSDDRRRMFLNMRSSKSLDAINGYDVARQLLMMASPASDLYQPSWANLMHSVRVEDVSRVVVDLRHPHVLPQAHLQTRLDVAGKATQRYALEMQQGSEMRFVPLEVSGEQDALRPVIVERFYANPREPIADLAAGKIDIIDRVLPLDAMRLRDHPDLIVGQYAFPNVHVLIPNPETESEYLKNRTFRRALVYGINREVILDNGLLNGKKKEERELQANHVVSGPFSAGVIDNDPSAYAYDNELTARPYDPVMATILVKLATNQLATLADQKEEPAPELGELVLAYPGSELTRFVCKQIQMQLEVIGVTIKLRELPPGETRVADGQYDLLYAELLAREPLVDASRLFGPGGPCESTDPYVRLALRQLENSETWAESRQYLQDLHRLVYNNISVLPLWQMIDHFVYHRGLQGVTARPVFFYQNVDQWRVVPPVLKE